jgi:DNA-dependent RNA polymerase auxiliary subunit epsilon
MVVNDELIINKQKKEDVRKKMKEHKFIDIEMLESITWTKFTLEEIEKLQKKLDTETEHLDYVTKKKTKHMWLDDLNELDIEQLEKVLVIDSEE